MEHPDPTSTPEDPANEGQERVLASMVRETLAAFSALGIAQAELMKTCGLPPGALDDPDALVDYEAMFRLWETVLDRFPARPIGLTLARHGAQSRRDAMGVFGYATRHCRDVRQSIELFIRYCPMMFPRLSLSLRVVENTAQLVVEHEPRVLAMVEPIELFVASLVLGFGDMNEQAPQPTEIFFAHAPKHPAEIYAEVLGDTVRFCAGWNGFAFDAAALDLPITGADPKIGKYLQQHADAQLDTRTEGSADQSFDTQVRALIDDGLMAGQANQISVAQALGMSPRTLQRRLEELGTSFARQLEQVRHQRALQLLVLPRLSMGEVAFMLGYGSSRAFHRSFRRWTGQTPSEYRQRQGP
ncbi:MAG: AraC family transcriptional regulator ligand-binding domain-containing protein [Myxococcota bacterium]